ncbi:MAG: S8 family serine peptidase, partial [Thermomicrobiales bacterium]
KDIPDGASEFSCVVVNGACSGEVIVGFKAGKGPADAQAILDQFGGTVIDSIEGRSMALIRVTGDAGSFISALKSGGAVQWAEFNTVDQQPIGSPRSFYPRSFVTPASATQDAINSSVALDAVKGEEAAACFNGSGVKVAVIDTGVDESHPFISGRTALGFNAFTRGADYLDAGNGIDDDNDGQIDGAVGHGTHVAGIIRQIAPGATIVPIKALDSEGTGQAFYLAVALDYAINSGARVINLSLGAAQPSQAVTDLIDAAKQSGIVIAAAGGNSGNGQQSFPAATDESNLAGVAATDNGKKLASFSSRYEALDLAAPGVDVISSFPVGVDGIETGWATWSGSSMSTAWVSGAAADILSAHPDWTAKQVLHQMTETADKLAGATGGMERESRLNAQAAVCGK